MRRRECFLRLVLELARRSEGGRTVLDDDWLFAGIDEEVERWGRAVLEGLTAEEIRREFRWSERHACRIEWRWRRYLKALARTRASAGIVRTRTDPSRTVEYREFFDPATKRKLGYWEFPVSIQ